MLDINLVRENPEKVKAGIKSKGYPEDLVDKVLEIDTQRREFLQEIENLRSKKNQAAKQQSIEEGKKVKEVLQQKKPEFEKIEQSFNELLNQLPNLPALDVPIGQNESENKIIRTWGDTNLLTFAPKDHLELGQTLDILDFEKGAEVAGSGFYYLKAEGAILELALCLYGLNFLRNKGYIPIITPDLAKEKYYLGTGYLPKGPEAQIYKIDGLDLGLVATAEITLAGYHSKNTFTEADLPKKYAGYSHCFRQEAGAYGKYSKGLYRVHQFTKVEMFAFTKPDQSEKVHQEFLANEEDFFQSLGIPYRVLEMCTGDLGAQAVKKYDLEAWMMGRGDWGEVTSASNTTDYQARNLDIKYKENNQTTFVHTLNGTLCAIPRILIAILENNQQADGSVKIPEVLIPYTGFSEIRQK